MLSFGGLVIPMDLNEIFSEQINNEFSDYESEAKMRNDIHEIQETLKRMQSDSEKESKLNAKRFWINFFIALIAAIAAVVSASPYIISFVSTLISLR